MGEVSSRSIIAPRFPHREHSASSTAVPVYPLDEPQFPLVPDEAAVRDFDLVKFLGRNDYRLAVHPCKQFLCHHANTFFQKNIFDNVPGADKTFGELELLPDVRNHGHLNFVFSGTPQRAKEGVAMIKKYLQEVHAKNISMEMNRRLFDFVMFLKPKNDADRHFELHTDDFDSVEPPVKFFNDWRYFHERGLGENDFQRVTPTDVAAWENLLKGLAEDTIFLDRFLGKALGTSANTVHRSSYQFQFGTSSNLRGGSLAPRSNEDCLGTRDRSN